MKEPTKKEDKEMAKQKVRIAATIYDRNKDGYEENTGAYREVVGATYLAEANYVVGSYAVVGKLNDYNVYHVPSALRVPTTTGPGFSVPGRTADSDARYRQSQGLRTLKDAKAFADKLAESNTLPADRPADTEEVRLLKKYLEENGAKDSW